MHVQRIAGEPFQLGVQHGAALASTIRRNVQQLLGWHRVGNAHCLAEAEAWVAVQARRHFAAWPWLAEELRGIAAGSDLPYEQIEQMNFRIWQFSVFGAGHACSNMLVRLPDGQTALAGTLDDPIELYAVLDVRPATGHRYITFPIAGTVWGSRGLNAAGLAIGISSVPLGGLRFSVQCEPWQQDICLRAILQTCTTSDEVVRFCRNHRFPINLLVADAFGTQYAITNTPLGTFVHGPEIRCLTNHLPPALVPPHRAAGWDGRVLARSSERRWEQLECFIRAADRRSLEEIREELARRGADDELVNNTETAFATVALPQASPPCLWIAERPVTAADFRHITLEKT